MEERIAQIHRSVEAGADEIDVVIKREHAVQGAGRRSMTKSRRFEQRAGRRLMKVILATGDCKPRQYRARQPRGHDGRRRLHQDFHRQGSGERHPAGRHRDDASYSRLRAKRPACRRIQARGRHPHRKAGAGISGGRERGAGRALAAAPDLFRIGASSVLDDIERTCNSLLS